MNTQLTLENKWTALVFGALFNGLTSSFNEQLADYVLKTLAGGLIWFVFQIASDYTLRKIKQRETSGKAETTQKQEEPAEKEKEPE